MPVKYRGVAGRSRPGKDEMAEYVHERDPKTGKVKVVRVNRVNRGIDPETSSGTIKDGPISRIVDGFLKKRGK